MTGSDEAGTLAGMHASRFATSGSSGDDWAERARRMNVPENELPGIATAPQVLARTGDAALWLGPAEVFTTGIRLSVHLLLRRSDVATARSEPWSGMREALLGVQLADGRRIVGDSQLGGWPGADDGPALIRNGGGGGGRTYSYQWYLTPLPAGDLVVVVSLPDAGLTEGRATIPAAGLAAAHAAVVTLWPWERDVDPPQPPRWQPEPPEGGWFAEALGEPPG